MRIIADLLLWMHLLTMLFVFVALNGQFMPDVVLMHLEKIVFFGYTTFIASAMILIFSKMESKRELVPLYLTAFAINALIAYGHYAFYHILDDFRF